MEAEDRDLSASHGVFLGPALGLLDSDVAGFVALSSGVEASEDRV